VIRNAKTQRGSDLLVNHVRSRLPVKIPTEPLESAPPQIPTLKEDRPNPRLQPQRLQSPHRRLSRLGSQTSPESLSSRSPEPRPESSLEYGNREAQARLPTQIHLRRDPKLRARSWPYYRALESIAQPPAPQYSLPKKHKTEPLPIRQRRFRCRAKRCDQSPRLSRTCLQR
jgi:hypothetical protein